MVEVLPYLIEVSGSKLPGFGGKVDVVAIMNLGQVVETAGLHHISHTSPLMAAKQHCRPAAATDMQGQAHADVQQHQLHRRVTECPQSRCDSLALSCMLSISFKVSRLC